MNTFKIIRKEIISHEFKLFESCLETLAENLSEERDSGKSKLPEEWIVDKHDRMLLKALSEHGYPFLSKLRENTDYGFENINVSKKML